MNFQPCTLPHNLIKDKPPGLIERTFSKKEGELYIARNDKNVFFTSTEDINFGLVRMYLTPYRFSGTIFMPPTLKKLMGHIAFGACVGACVGRSHFLYLLLLFNR